MLQRAAKGNRPAYRSYILALFSTLASRPSPILNMHHMKMKALVHPCYVVDTSDHLISLGMPIIHPHQDTPDPVVEHSRTSVRCVQRHRRNQMMLLPPWSVFERGSQHATLVLKQVFIARYCQTLQVYCSNSRRKLAKCTHASTCRSMSCKVMHVAISFVCI